VVRLSSACASEKLGEVKKENKISGVIILIILGTVMAPPLLGFYQQWEITQDILNGYGKPDYTQVGKQEFAPKHAQPFSQGHLPFNAFQEPATMKNIKRKGQNTRLCQNVSDRF